MKSIKGPEGSGLDAATGGNRERRVATHERSSHGTGSVREDSNRKVEVEWDSTKEYSYPVRIRVYSDDKKGLLAEISSSIASNEANITNARVDTTDDRRAIGTFELQIRI